MAKILGHDIVLAAELKEVQDKNVETMDIIQEAVLSQRKAYDAKLENQNRRFLILAVITVALNLVTLAIAFTK